MNKPLRPSRVATIGGELAIVWEDGSESYLSQEQLRRACPCASCAGEPDVLGKIVRPSLSYSAKSFSVAAWEYVGGYAFRPTWEDGHASGIFPWELLKSLADSPR